MRFQNYLSLLASISSTLALQLGNGQLLHNGNAIAFSETGKAVSFNSTTEKIDISFDIKHIRQPDQIFLKVSNSKGQETSFKPITRLSDEVGLYKSKFTLSYDKLPKLFQSERNPLDVHLIVADIPSESNNDANLFQKIGALELTESLIAESSHVPVERFGLKPEIHHIFQTAPKTVNSLIAIVFAVIVQLVLIGLIGVWFGTGSLNFQNLEINVSNLAFFGLIFSYEVVFLQYSLGSSIFDTLGKSLILLGPTIWFGSRVLNKIGELRLAGKR